MEKSNIAAIDEPFSDLFWTAMRDVNDVERE